MNAQSIYFLYHLSPVTLLGHILFDSSKCAFHFIFFFLIFFLCYLLAFKWSLFVSLSLIVTFSSMMADAFSLLFSEFLQLVFGFWFFTQYFIYEIIKHIEGIRTNQAKI